MIALKLLGAIDVITALALFMHANMLFLTVPLFVIHIIKGIASMGGDVIGKLYGCVDILSSFAILFVFVFPFPVNEFLIIILLFKGVTSLL